MRMDNNSPSIWKQFTLIFLFHLITSFFYYKFALQVYSHVYAQQFLCTVILIFSGASFSTRQTALACLSENWYTKNFPICTGNKEKNWQSGMYRRAKTNLPQENLP